MPKGGKGTYGWKASLAGWLRRVGFFRSGGGKVGFRTVEKRSEVLFAAYRKLRELGYQLERAEQIGNRHVRVLVAEWEKEGLAPATISSRVSILRVMCEAMGKRGMVLPVSAYTSTPDRAARSTINKTDKSWAAHGVDVAAKIEEVRAFNPRIGVMLDLQHEFGMRAGESLQFRPFAACAYGENLVCIRWGTKGGRERFQPVETPEQRRVLELAKTFASDRNGSVSDPSLSLKSARGLYWRTVARFGLTKRSLGVTSHGLRHGYCLEKYKELTGEDAPVRGGGEVAPDLDQFSRDQIARSVGHSRVAIVAAYLGKGGAK
jgi:integrase